MAFARRVELAIQQMLGEWPRLRSTRLPMADIASALQDKDANRSPRAFALGRGYR
jgi:hypothetical protein